MHRWCYRYTYCSHTFCFHQYHSVHYAQHALMMNPVSAKKMVMLLQEAYPARPKVDEQNKNRLIFFEYVLAMNVTGNAFSQLPSCNADRLQPDAGHDLILLFHGDQSDHMIVGWKYVKCNVDPNGPVSSQSFQKEKMRKRNKIHTKVSIPIVHILRCFSIESHTDLSLICTYLFWYNLDKGDYSSLWAEVGKEVLPSEYGGEGGPVADIEGNLR